MGARGGGVSPYHEGARELSRRLRVADGILAELVVQVTDAYLGKRR